MGTLTHLRRKERCAVGLKTTESSPWVKEEHARLRKLAAAALTPRAVRRMEQQIREVVNRIALPLRGRDGDVVDLLGQFTNVVPNAVMSRITGVPPGDDEQRFCSIAQAVIKGALPFTPQEVQLEAERGFREFSAWVREMVTKRRSHPEEDLVTDLLRAKEADEALSEDDIVLLLASLIGAGSEATSQVGTAIVRTLLNQPAALRAPSKRAAAHSPLDERDPSLFVQFARGHDAVRRPRFRVAW